jgi:hypothetical protein
MYDDQMPDTGTNEPEDRLAVLAAERSHRRYASGVAGYEIRAQHGGFWLNVADAVVSALAFGVSFALLFIGIGAVSLWGDANPEERLYLILIPFAVTAPIAYLYLTRFIDLAKAKSPRTVISLTLLAAQIPLVLLLGVWALSVA